MRGNRLVFRDATLALDSTGYPVEKDGLSRGRQGPFRQRRQNGEDRGDHSIAPGSMQNLGLRVELLTEQSMSSVYSLLFPALRQRQHPATRSTFCWEGTNCSKGRQKMSKKRGIWGIRFSLPATLDWCKRTAGKYWRGVSGVTGGRRNDQFQTAQLNHIKQPLPTRFCEERIELKEFLKILSIGDRLRVLCDDGLLVVEKISHTQYKLIHSQMMSEFVH